MSKRINYNEIQPNDPRFRDWDKKHTAGHGGLRVDIHRLHELTEHAPVEKIPLDTFTSELKDPCWTHGGSDKDSNDITITPREVIDAIKEYGYADAVQHYPKFARHIEKIQNVDWSYPVHVYEGQVVDGMHRISRLVLDTETNVSSQNFITIKRLNTIPKAAIIQDE